MKQPTRRNITDRLKLVLFGQISREELCTWAMDYIRNDSKFSISDVDGWHYLVAISNIDEMISPDEYLFCEEDIKDIMHRYSDYEEP